VNRLAILFFILIALITGCVSSTLKADPTAKVTITKIVNKSTGELVTNAIIILRWEDPNSEIIRIEQYQSLNTLSDSLPADGQTRLWVCVEAPGFLPWGLAIRLKLNENKPVTFPVEMIPLAVQEQG
jgi:hypothetical protein